MKNKLTIILQLITILFLATTMLTPQQKKQITTQTTHLTNITHLTKTLQQHLPQQAAAKYPYPTIERAPTWNYTCINYAADLEHKLEQQNQSAGIAILYHLTNSYHAMTAIKKNDTIYYLDPQTNKQYTAQDIFNRKNKEYNTTTTRIVSKFGVEHNPFFIPSNTNR